MWSRNSVFQNWPLLLWLYPENQGSFRAVHKTLGVLVGFVVLISLFWDLCCSLSMIPISAEVWAFRPYQRYITDVLSSSTTSEPMTCHGPTWQIFWLVLGPALMLWSCLMITGLGLTLSYTHHTWSWLLAWPETSVITTNMADDLDCWF